MAIMVLNGNAKGISAVGFMVLNMIIKGMPAGTATNGKGISAEKKKSHVFMAFCSVL